jgi:hypothetical protein
MADVESLELQITGDAQSAERSIDSLIGTLGRLKTAAQGGAGLNGIANPLQKISGAINSLSGSGQKLKDFAEGLQALSGASNFKISSNIASQITAISNAIKSTPTDFSPLTNLTNAVQPLANLGKGGLGTLIGQIKKIPEAMAALNQIDMGSFAAKIQQVATAMQPLANEMQKVANGFSAFPAKIQAFIASSSKVPTANKASSKSFVNLASKITVAYLAMRKIGSIFASFLKSSNDYIENANVFGVAMGEYAESAFEYASNVSEALGIDISDWMKNQGVMMSLAKGFGVAGDRASVMSQQLTQLSYDLSSFYNIDVERAMYAVKSAFSGELESARNLAYDTSNARLQEIAETLGIKKKIAAMNQAEKAELRYYALMTQVTHVQGDLARTLDEPANMLRVLKAQFVQAGRAIGDLFLPMLKAILPVAIAVAKVITVLVKTIAGLFGVEFGEMDWSKTANTFGASVQDASDGLGKATGKAKELKKTLLGIDELNVLPDKSSGGGSGSGVGGGGFDFELPTYDPLEGLVENQIDEITEKMKEWLGISDEINSWSELFETRLGKILIAVGAIGTAFGLWKIGTGLYAAFSAISTAIGTASGAWTGFSTAVTTATGVSLGPILAIVAAVVALVAGLTAVYLTNEDVKKSVDNAIASIGESLVPLFEFVSGTVLPNLKSAWDKLLVILKPLGDWVKKVFTSIWEDMLIPALEWIASDVIPDVTSVFENLWNKVLIPLGSFIGSVLTPVIRILTDVLNWLWQYVTLPIANFLGGVFSTAWKNLVKIWNETVIPRLNTVISVLQFLWNNVLSPIVNFLWSVFAPGFQEVFRGVSDKISAAKNVFEGLLNFVTGIFTRDWKQAWNGVVQTLGGVFSGLKATLATPLNRSLATFESFINKIISGWNSLKRQLNKLSLKMPDWLGGGTFAGFNLGMSSKISLPRLADGGMVNSGQMFVAREAGPELVGTIGGRTAVVNNDQIVESVAQGVYRAFVQANAESGGNQVVEAKVNDKVLFEVIVGRNRQETMRTGRSPLLGGV